MHNFPKNLHDNLEYPSCLAKFEGFFNKLNAKSIPEIAMNKAESSRHLY